MTGLIVRAKARTYLRGKGKAEASYLVAKRLDCVGWLEFVR